MVVAAQKRWKKFGDVNISPYLCTRKTHHGTLAERLGNGLQNRGERFNSARYLFF